MVCSPTANMETFFKCVPGVVSDVHTVLWLMVGCKNFYIAFWIINSWYQLKRNCEVCPNIQKPKHLPREPIWKSLSVSWYVLLFLYLFTLLLFIVYFLWFVRFKMPIVKKRIKMFTLNFFFQKITYPLSVCCKPSRTIIIIIFFRFSQTKH